MSFLTDIRADTSNILTDVWQESVEFQRVSATTGKGGSRAMVWTTNRTTVGDVQEIESGGFKSAAGNQAGAHMLEERVVVLRHGSDVINGDRFLWNSRQHYVRHVIRHEDRVLAFGAPKKKE